VAKLDGKFESARQDWETPQELFDYINGYFGFTFDLAASSENTKCNAYFTEDDNALLQEWHGICWLNPPYGGTGGSKLSEWIEKAYTESARDTCEVAMLMPARTNTNWWHNFCMRSQEIIFIKGRPKFGNAKHGLPQPLAIVYFTGNWWLRTKYTSLDIKEMRNYSWQPIEPPKGDDTNGSLHR
jgi:phage N-6-adenine-methyltransferase